MTDVAAVTGFPEMLDGRVKTLHPRVHAGILADRRLRRPSAPARGGGDRPVRARRRQPLPVRRGARTGPGIELDELVEEIDIGGPSMVRAAAKNHASVAIVTSPGALPGDPRRARGGGERARSGCASALAIEAFRHTAAYDARIAAELPPRMAAAGVALPDEPGLPGARDPYPPTLTIGLEKVETLRYGENPHQPAARYRRAGEPRRPAGPFATGEPPLQGKALSYNNVLDASAAAALARLAPRARAASSSSTRTRAAPPSGRRCSRRGRPPWPAIPCRRSAASSRSARPVDGGWREALTSIFLEVVVAPGFDADALAVLAAKPNLRLVVDPSLGATAPRPSPPDPLGAIRTAGGAVLVDRARRRARRSGAPGRSPARRRPDGRRAARPGPRLAARAGRHQQRDRAGQGRPAGRARVRARRAGSTPRARRSRGRGRSPGPTRRSARPAASDAFFPFPDGVEACLAAGVTAFVQPGGSVRDAEVDRGRRGGRARRCS